MKKETDKEDRLIKDIMKDFQMEIPSDGFTDRVMQQIQLEHNLSRLKSGPLISRNAWIGIAASLIALIIYLYFGFDSSATIESSWMSKLLTSSSIPSVELSIHEVFSKINLGSSVLFWILMGSVGIFILTILERLMETTRSRQFLLF